MIKFIFSWRHELSILLSYIVFVNSYFDRSSIRSFLWAYFGQLVKVDIAFCTSKIEKVQVNKTTKRILNFKSCYLF